MAVLRTSGAANAAALSTITAISDLMIFMVLLVGTPFESLDFMHQIRQSSRSLKRRWTRFWLLLLLVRSAPSAEGYLGNRVRGSNLLFGRGLWILHDLEHGFLDPRHWSFNHRFLPFLTARYCGAPRRCICRSRTSMRSRRS